MKKYMIALALLASLVLPMAAQADGYEMKQLTTMGNAVSNQSVFPFKGMLSCADDQHLKGAALVTCRIRYSTTFDQALTRITNHANAGVKSGNIPPFGACIAWIKKLAANHAYAQADRAVIASPSLNAAWDKWFYAAEALQKMVLHIAVACG